MFIIMVDKDFYKLYNKYMINLVEKIVCLFKGHDLSFAGTCPYTQRAYNVCLRCTKMSPKIKEFDLVEEIDKEDV
jgi:hypothetical protein